MISEIIFIITTGTIILAISAFLVFLAAKDQKETKPSLLTILALGLASTGIVFAGDRILSYSLMGTGIVISMVEFFRFAKMK